MVGMDVKLNAPGPSGGTTIQWFTVLGVHRNLDINTVELWVKSCGTGQTLIVGLAEIIGLKVNDEVSIQFNVTQVQIKGVMKP
jgi:hypothetical protein